MAILICDECGEEFEPEYEDDIQETCNECLEGEEFDDDNDDELQ